MHVSAAVPLFLIFLTISLPAMADSNLLLLAEQRSIAAGHNAKAKQADLEIKAKNDLSIAREKALNLGEEVAHRLKGDAANLQQDLIDGKAAVVNVLSCEIKNKLNGAEEKVTLQTNGNKIVDHILIPLKKLFPGDAIRANEAISFVTSIQDSKRVQLQLIDLSDGNKVLRTGSLLDLDLASLDQNCNPNREIVYLNHGNVEINTQSTLPKDAIQQVGKAVIADIKTIGAAVETAQ